MRHPFLILCVLSLATSAGAESFRTGSWGLFPTAGYQPDGFCDRGAVLVLDQGEVAGNLAILENFVEGDCEILIIPDKRFYEIRSVEADGCGSLLSRGTRQVRDQVWSIEIIDNRNRSCEDVIAALIEVVEKGPGGIERRWYSYDFDEGHDHFEEDLSK